MVDKTGWFGWIEEIPEEGDEAELEIEGPRHEIGTRIRRLYESWEKVGEVPEEDIRLLLTKLKEIKGIL